MIVAMTSLVKKLVRLSYFWHNWKKAIIILIQKLKKTNPHIKPKISKLQVHIEVHSQFNRFNTPPYYV